MNILLFTTHYPDIHYDNKQTLADHYFAREWVKLGHRVVVIHIDIEFFPKKVLRELNGYKSTSSFNLDNVEIHTIGVSRYFPKSAFLFKNTINRNSKSILLLIEKIGIIPDIVFVDFCYSQWEIISQLRSYLKVNIIPIFNNCDIGNFEKVKGILSDSSLIGVRSKKISIELNKISTDNTYFVIYSGAPNEIFTNYIKETEQCEQLDKYKLLYVGDLIPLKNVNTIIDALNVLKDKYNFTLDIIGEGKSNNKLERMVKKYQMMNIVSFHGKLKREQVIKYMKESDCFIMVISPESFGIVYVEAMASGCYVIGSKNEGIDGIIIDHQNGVLVIPGNTSALIEELDYYFQLGKLEREKITSKAFEDSKMYSEETVANKIIEDVFIKYKDFL